MTTSAILVLFACLTKFVVADDYTPEAIADQVNDLPGAENLDIPFKHFSGYLSIPGTDGSLSKKMHYWFTESSNNPSKDPVAFWTNGGPGCSGLLGFLTENGPFRPNKDLSLSMNDYSWNKVANMVFIEQPCGVGFSYSTQTTDAEHGVVDDYHHDDASAAKDNYALIQAFLTRFPQLKSNSLYITSESYGGHYMPTLAKEIVDANKGLSSNDEKYLNFKGFAVGNPATTIHSTIPASLETYWGHQLVSKPLYEKYEEECVGTHPKDWGKCEMYFLKMYMQIGNLNPYALDYPVCVDESRSKAKYGRSQRTWLIQHSLGAIEEQRKMQTSSSSNDTSVIEDIKKTLHLEPVEGYEPCAENYMITYLNQAKVKEALHVKTDIEWADCSRSIRYKQTDGFKSMTPIYNYLIDGKFDLDILVYSGDDDDVCATIGTQSWIWDLGYRSPHGETWKDYTVNGQTAGYITKWKDTRFALATVHGAGHEVPTYKPDVALYLFEKYLNGEITNE